MAILPLLSLLISNIYFLYAPALFELGIAELALCNKVAAKDAFTKCKRDRKYRRAATDYLKQENFDYSLETYILDNHFHKEQCEEKIKWIESDIFKEEIYDQIKFSVLHNVENFTNEQQAFLVEYFGLNNNFHTV